MRIHTSTYKAPHIIAIISYMELDGGGALAVLGRDDGRLDDLDRAVAGAVATSHIVV